MPAPNLDVDWRRFRSESARLQKLMTSLPMLPPHHRKLTAEIMMVRLFLLVEGTVRSISGKLLCGATYCDGTPPMRLVTPRSAKAAFDLMKNFGRSKQIGLSWTQGKKIRENLNTTLDHTDSFFQVVTNHAAHLTQMRYVRNHIAHGNDGTRSNFRKVVINHYGGLKQGMTPGLILLTNTLGVSTLMESYIKMSRVMVRELVRA